MNADQKLLYSADAIIALVGFGEAAAAFTMGWREQGLSQPVRAFDVKTDCNDETIVRTKWDEYEQHKVIGSPDRREMLDRPCVIFSLVTADQAYQAALETAGIAVPGSIYFDCNSCAPSTKLKSAAAFDSAGIDYVDTAIMAPVFPSLHKTPILISGPNNNLALKLLETLGMEVTPAGTQIGQASSIKMMRSVMMKGMEALTLECFLAARKAGIDQHVLASLASSNTGIDCGERISYHAERMTRHGIRRAAEMREVEKTIRDLNLNAWMTSSIVKWQQQLGELDLNMKVGEYQSMLDELLLKLNHF